MSDTVYVVKLTEATRMLAECKTFDDGKQIRDLAESARQYARMQQLGTEAYNHAMEIKLRAERRMGEMLRTAAVHVGRPEKNSTHIGTIFPQRVTLEDVGIGKKHSAAFQILAALPEEQFEAHLAQTKAQGTELSSAALYEEAKTYRKHHPVPKRTASASKASTPPPTFNATNEMVDWAKWTWNPVTGCRHTCVYCYARDIAERFYPQGFAPTFHADRLKAPHYTKVPKEAEEQIGYRNVFVCSMADLFGKWVPDAWIDAVMAEVRAAPQWNFLFLTKFPQRLESIDWPHNAWVGTTVDEQYRVPIAEKAFRNVNASVKWLSCEPLRERLTFPSLTMFDWVVIGGQSKSTQAPAFQPPWEWVKHLMRQADEAGCLLYWKPNLFTRPQEYPGQPEAPAP